jgi:hypothetical protein
VAGADLTGMTPEHRKRNLRLAFILASIALAFLLGFVAKVVLFGV